MSLTCHKNSRAVERILPQKEKLKKMKAKDKRDQLNPAPIYVMMLRSKTNYAEYWRKSLEKTEAEKILKGKTGNRREDPSGDRL